MCDTYMYVHVNLYPIQYGNLILYIVYIETSHKHAPTLRAKDARVMCGLTGMPLPECKNRKKLLGKGKQSIFII